MSIINSNKSENSYNSSLSENVNTDLFDSIKSTFNKTTSAITDTANEKISGLNNTLEKSINNTKSKIESATKNATKSVKDSVKNTVNKTKKSKKPLLDDDLIAITENDMKSNNKTLVNKPVGSKGIFTFFDNDSKNLETQKTKIPSKSQDKSALISKIDDELNISDEKSMGDGDNFVDALSNSKINEDITAKSIESNINFEEMSDEKISNNNMPNMPNMPNISIPIVAAPFTFITGLKLVAIIVLIAFLGLNIFTFLSYGTDLITQSIKIGLGPVIQGLMNTIQNAAMGASKATQKLGTVALSKVNNKTDDDSNFTKKKSKNEKKQDEEIYDENKDIIPKKAKTDNIEIGLIEKETKQNIENNGSYVVESDDYSRNIQQAKKSGYCYIGSDRGYRTCTKINEGEICMSGDIFPTMDQCVNPRLR